MTATTARDGIAPTTRSLAGWPWRDRLFAAGRRCGISGRGLVVAIPYVWLLLLFAAPFVIVAKISVSQQQTALPPYTPLIQMVEEGNVKLPGQDEPNAPGVAGHAEIVESGARTRVQARCGASGSDSRAPRRGCPDCPL